MDDFIHAHVLSGSRELEGYNLPWWRLFQFSSPETNRVLFDDGVLSWWTDEKSQLSFFRPLSALTHRVDYALWPDSPMLMHAHSLAWAIVALLAIGGLYDMVLAPRWVAALALALYAFSSSRGITVAWIANRNALVASALSIFAVVLYMRGQRGLWLSRWASPVFFGLGILAGEGAFGGGAYLVANAFYLQKGDVKKRFYSLLPHVAVSACCVTYARLAGYGVFRSGEYLDPLNDFTHYLKELPVRSMVGLFAAVGGPRAEWWNSYELIVPGLSTVFVVCAILGLAYCAWLLYPLLRRSAVARFWLTGTFLSLLPAAAAPPGGRVLTWLIIGMMGLFAEYLATYLAGQENRGAAAIAGVYGIALLHLIVSPLMLPLSCWTVADVGAMLEKADRAVPRTPDIRERTVIYINPPQEIFSVFVPAMRAVQGVARPRTQRWLATGLTAIEVRRTDEWTLELRPQAGFIHERTEQVSRDPDYRFAVGDRVMVSGMTVEILEITADGRPASARFVFDRPLEDPKYFWLVWRGHGYIPFSPPDVGVSVSIAENDFLSVVFGSHGQVSKLSSYPR
jgi:hypothetical protein